MIRKKDLLDNVRIATPCPARWADMDGDDRMRFCKLCQLNVYDVSAMTREEAEQLIRSTSGRLCMRLHRRADGRLITKDCPVGVSAMRRRIAYMVASATAIVIAAYASSAAIWTSGESPEDSTFGQIYAKAKDRALRALSGGHEDPTTSPVPAGAIVFTAPLGRVVPLGAISPPPFYVAPTPLVTAKPVKHHHRRRAKITHKRHR